MPVVVLVVVAFVGIGLLLAGAAYLRPRVLRLLSGPLPRRRTTPRQGAVDA